ncbi:MAG: tRNA pseudouridine(38-40) synthase TruA [Gammaproteobacteria bacterium]|nr:tRNA pseudouridine(38-40) synthase TruA [Gammaproteobacteria bacterium]MDH5594371.1 tRNA pseudouridine(38-40) synthase TruA [Gammaproteobacteria bacterium]MDH5614183.1 tRNA pseudouridine(38-40) synthase TruA [Gammaproteobacteria bacterium]
MRIALGVEYNGSHYNGWQYQDHSPSIQEAVEKALSTVANEKVTAICAGRTDTGVHAMQQVIHFETEVERTDYSWLHGGNANLPKDISFLWAKQVSEDFHARYTATARQYRYVILNRDVRPSYLKSLVSWEFRPLDAKPMHEAARHLIGEHDFSSYRAMGCQSKHANRCIHFINVSRHGDFIYIDIEANAFLYHMVRNIAGVLIEIGAGEQPVDWSKEVLEYRDRTKGGVTAPPDGLYLANVIYPEEFDIPVRELTNPF